jgi:hypothetical protein
MNEQLQANRDKDMRDARRSDVNMKRGEDQREQLSTRDIAGGAAAKTAKDVSERERDANRREMQVNEESSSTSLFETGEAESLRSRWTVIQTQFVDEPRQSVERADELVASTMKRLAQIFANEREGLEHNWDRGDNVSTEDLRIALQRYRSFFDRLLSV